MGTTSPLGADFAAQAVSLFLKSVDDAKARACRMIWDTVMQLVYEHWVALLFILITLIVLALLVYLTTGRWAMLGSIAYHIVFGLLLYLSLLILHPEFCANDAYDIVVAVLYVVSFTLVHLFLVSSGIKKRW